ncbi:MAG: TonB-dependent receptor [Pseudomonadales bacterium]
MIDNRGNCHDRSLDKVGSISMLLLTLSVMVGDGHAQEQKSEMTLEEVIVTAQKREQRLLDVPIAISVLSDRLIRDARIEDLSDVAMLTPNLEIGNSIGRQTSIVSMRGVNPGLFGSPTVLVYQDGFTMGDTRIKNNSTLFDLERIEVLKGPQATLYGRNSLGGVIHYITRKPSSEFEGFLEASYGNYDDTDLAVSLTGPLVEDRLGYRLTVGYQQHEGYWDNRLTGEKNVNDEQDANVRLNLFYTPNERFSVDLSLDYSESDDNCGDCPNFANTFDADNPMGLGAGTVDTNEYVQTVNQDSLGLFKRDVAQAVVTAEYEMENAILTSISGYGYMDSNLVADINRLPGPSIFGPLSVEAFDLVIDLKVFSQELRLASAGNTRFEWLLGGYYFQDESTRSLDVLLTPPQDAQLGQPNFSNASSDTENVALFFDGSYDLNEKWTIGFGLRYDRETKERNDVIGGIQQSKTVDEWLPKFTMSYKPSDAVNWYLTVSSGYKAGGFNTPSAPIDEYSPEYLENYELGFKGLLWGGLARLETAVFYMQWSDQQINRTTQLENYVDNAAKSTISGFEAAISVKPMDGLEFTASAAYLDAEFDEYLDSTSVPDYFGLDPDYSGNDILMTPNIVLAMSGQYTLDLVDGWNMKTRADARYTGDRNFHASGALPQDSYNLVNLYMGVERESLELGFYADNVFDEGYHTFGVLEAGGPPFLWTAAPRTYGIKASLRF